MKSMAERQMFRLAVLLNVLAVSAIVLATTPPAEAADEYAPYVQRCCCQEYTIIDNVKVCSHYASCGCDQHKNSTCGASCAG